MFVQMKAEKSLVYHRDFSNYCRSAAHEIQLVQEAPFCGTRLSKVFPRLIFKCFKCFSSILSGLIYVFQRLFV